MIAALLTPRYEWEYDVSALDTSWVGIGVPVVLAPSALRRFFVRAWQALWAVHAGSESSPVPVPGTPTRMVPPSTIGVVGRLTTACIGALP